MGNIFMKLGVIILALFVSQSYAATVPASRDLCNYPDSFTCIKVRGGETWYSLFPNAETRDKVMRLNRMNTRLYPGLIIAVPNNVRDTSLMDISPFYQHIRAPGRKVIIYDPAVYAWGAYDADGNLVKWGPASSGKAYCPDVHRGCRTPHGTFAVYDKNDAGCKSKIFPVGKGGAPMPYCMYFHGGYALHGSPEVPGYHASHGCVRIYTEDARWLNHEFIDLPGENGSRGTMVIVRPYPSSSAI